MFDKVLMVILPSNFRLVLLLFPQRLHFCFRVVGQTFHTYGHCGNWRLCLQHAAEKNPETFAITFQVYPQQPTT
jgi:hypothetical protein